MGNDDLLLELKGIHQASYRWALICCAGNRADAEDLLGDCYLKASEGKAIFKGHCALKTWWFKVIRNTHRSKWRSFSRRVARELGWLETDYPDLVQVREPHHLALLKLPENERQVLVLRGVEEMKFEEIAKLLGCTKSKAKQHFKEGKEAMALMLGQEAG